MGPGIFISYRRDDSGHASGRLVDRLAQSFSREQLFMDVDAIEPGHDFREVIIAKVAACDVMLAVIGHQWLEARNEAGERRLDDPDDFVRVEIETALQRGIHIIPLLVDGAQMPRGERLPQSMAKLAGRQAMRVDYETFGSDAERVAKVLQKRMGTRRLWLGRPTEGHQYALAAHAASPQQSTSAGARWSRFPWSVFAIGTLIGTSLATAGLWGLWPEDHNMPPVVLAGTFASLSSLLAAVAFYVAMLGRASRLRVLLAATMFGAALSAAAPVGAGLALDSTPATGVLTLTIALALMVFLVRCLARRLR